MSALSNIDINSAASTPFLPWLFSGSLLTKGLASSPKQVVKNGVITAVKTVPSRASCLTFGATNFLGGYMIMDGDVENGAGFTCAWSALYLIVNGRASLAQIIRGRITPLAFSVLALGNVGIFGKRYFWP